MVEGRVLKVFEGLVEKLVSLICVFKGTKKRGLIGCHLLEKGLSNWIKCRGRKEKVERGNANVRKWKKKISKLKIGKKHEK